MYSTRRDIIMESFNATVEDEVAKKELKKTKRRNSDI